MAVVAASTTGDTYTGVLLGIPGANSAAATMVDGFPMAKNGEATRALSAAITSSTANGLLFGSLTFLFLPYYTKVVMYMGIPELWALVLLAFVTVGFVSTRKYVRSTLAIVLGVTIGLVGVDVNNVPRFTMGWRYLEDGVQILPFVAGLFAIPELWNGWFNRKKTTSIKAEHGSWQDLKQGIKDNIRCWKDSIRGGAIGSFIGLLPGLGGAMADWLASGATVAANPKEKFGEGNVRGVVGAEGEHEQQIDRIRAALRTGIPIAFGSDAVTEIPGYTRGGLALTRIDMFTEAGTTPAHLVQPMTTEAARLLGAADTRGAIRPGMAADIVATPLNPLEDAQTLKNVSFVMKDGVIVRGG